tara:strand:- start:284 stop:562 length:279 start_codon:yes stop_codon:yes gene_type:complete
MNEWMKLVKKLSSSKEYSGKPLKDVLKAAKKIYKKTDPVKMVTKTTKSLKKGLKKTTKNPKKKTTKKPRRRSTKKPRRRSTKKTKRKSTTKK